MSASTFPDLLAARLRRDPSRPLVTAYDDATGERTELSVTTYANWVSKTANLLVDELGLDEGDTVLLDLPVHWLVPVFLGAAWSAGVAVTTDPTAEHALVVCGPSRLAALAPQGPGSAAVLACSLLPFAVRFRDPLPAGVLDFGAEWPGQSDVFAPIVAPTAGSDGWAAPAMAQGDLLARAASASYDEGVRLLTDVHPGADQGVPAFLGPLVHGGSVVLLVHADEATWPARHEDERATAELRAADQPPSV